MSLETNIAGVFILTSAWSLLLAGIGLVLDRLPRVRACLLRLVLR